MKFNRKMDVEKQRPFATPQAAAGCYSKMLHPEYKIKYMNPVSYLLFEGKPNPKTNYFR